MLRVGDTAASYQDGVWMDDLWSVWLFTSIGCSNPCNHPTWRDRQSYLTGERVSLRPNLRQVGELGRFRPTGGSA